MVKVFYLDISKYQYKESDLLDLFCARKDYIKSISDKKRKVQSLLVWKLLEYCLKNYFNYNNARFCTANGKWFDAYENIKFSLSHSNEMVAIAISSECSIGVDIEMCSEKILRLNSNITCGQKADNLIECLTKKWTEKESLFKSDIGTTFKSKVVYDNLKNNYVLTVCSCSDTVEFIEIYLENIM